MDNVDNRQHADQSGCGRSKDGDRRVRKGRGVGEVRVA